MADCQAVDFPLGTDSDRRRFWAKVSVQESDSVCWLWVGSRTSNGRYGQFILTSVHGRTQPIGAHRAAWELTRGAIPADHHVLHSCDTPLCVNPSHLFLGTHTDNMRDASAKGRLSVPRPARQKVTDAQVDEMVDLVRGGMLQVEVARRFGVSKAFVSRVLRGTVRQYRQRPDLRRSA